eukprot:7391134-Prymnesium_polylepis.1
MQRKWCLRRVALAPRKEEAREAAPRAHAVVQVLKGLSAAARICGTQNVFRIHAVVVDHGILALPVLKTRHPVVDIAIDPDEARRRIQLALQGQLVASCVTDGVV